MKQTPEQTLTKNLLKKDRQAQKTFYNLYSGYLSAVCSRYISDKEVLKDILQESFIKIFSSIDKFQFRGEGSLKAWAGKIVTNESLKHIRKDGFLQKFETIDNLGTEIPDNNEEEIDVTDIPPNIIQDMIKRLPQGYRAVFNLYVFEDMSHKEIAKKLGIRENSSASQLHRAKALLAKWINDYKADK